MEHLVDFHNFFDGLILSDDFAPQGGVKVLGIAASAAGIEHSGEIRSHRV
jgi:hypothetical protein